MNSFLMTISLNKICLITLVVMVVVFSALILKRVEYA